MASPTANSNVALNGRDIVIDYIKFKNPNIDEILRSQFITKKAKAATKTMRAEGKVNDLLFSPRQLFICSKGDRDPN